MSNAAVEDILESMAKWRLWTRMGLMEVRRRYRRTVLGPFWASLSLAILVGSMGVLFATLWKQDINTYLPFLATGFLAWLPVAAMITEGCSVFTQAEAVLKQMRLPLTLFACSTVWRNAIVFGHHLVVYVIVVLIFPVPVNWNTLLVIPGLALFWVNGIWITMMVGALATRFRDVQPLVASILQILMFVTPIFWPPELLSKRAAIFVDGNVLYHFVSVVRQPLLGQAPEPLSWYVVIGMTVIGWSLTILAFDRVRRHLPYSL